MRCFMNSKLPTEDPDDLSTFYAYSEMMLKAELCSFTNFCLDDWSTGVLSEFLVSLSARHLGPLAEMVVRSQWTGATLSTALTQARFDVDGAFGDSTQREAVRIFKRAWDDCAGISAIIPKLADMPMSVEDAKAKGFDTSNPGTTVYADNLDGGSKAGDERNKRTDEFHHENTDIRRQRPFYDHLSTVPTNPVQDQEPGAILPTKDHREIARYDAIVQMARALLELFPAQLAKIFRHFPSSDHFPLEGPMSEKSERVGSMYMTQNPADGAGLHTILDNIQGYAERADLSSNAPDQAQRQSIPSETKRSLPAFLKRPSSGKEAATADPEMAQRLTIAEAAVLKLEEDKKLDRDAAREISTSLRTLLVGGDWKTARDMFIKQRSVDEIFVYDALVSFFLDWHADIDFVKYWKSLYNNGTLTDPGTLANLTSQLDLLKMAPIVDKPHFDRTREHLDSMGLGVTKAAVMDAMGMFGDDKAQFSVPFPPHLDLGNKFHTRAYALALAETIVEFYVEKTGTPSTTKRRYTCPFKGCTHIGYLNRDDARRAVHISKCSQLPGAVRDPSHSDEDSGRETTQAVYIGVVMRTFLEMRTRRHKTRIGDGARLVDVYMRLRVYDYAAGNHHHYVCETIRLLHLVDGAASPRLAQQLKYERFINRHGGFGRNLAGDLVVEYDNRLIKPGVKRAVAQGKSSAGIILAVAKTRFLVEITEAAADYVDCGKEWKQRKIKARDTIIARLPDLLRELKTFSLDAGPGRGATRVLPSLGKKFMASPHFTVDMAALLEVVDRERVRDADWGFRFDAKAKQARQDIAEFGERVRTSSTRLVGEADVRVPDKARK